MRRTAQLERRVILIRRSDVMPTVGRAAHPTTTSVPTPRRRWVVRVWIERHGVVATVAHLEPVACLAIFLNAVVERLMPPPLEVQHGHGITTGPAHAGLTSRWMVIPLRLEP